MTSNDGTATPRPKSPNDTDSIRVAIGAMTGIIGDLEQSFNWLNAKSTELSAIGPGPQDAPREIQAVRRQIREENKKKEQEITVFKRMATEDVKEKIVANLRADILAHIKLEVAAQVKQQVEVQIQEQIPISLKEQSMNNKMQLQDARTSLTNSAARKKNANLRIQNLDEGLAVVLKSDGSKGKLFPADLRSLLSYDATSVRQLVNDYGLADDEARDVNVNRFLGHIGILFQLVVQA